MQKERTFFTKLDLFTFPNCVLRHVFPSAQLCIILNIGYIYIMWIFTVNFAFNKPAYLQYHYRLGDKIYDASNAVDGRKSDLSLGGGQCASSYPHKQTATRWVNLTIIRNIHHITIFYATGNKSCGMVIYYLAPDTKMQYQKSLELILERWLIR